MRKRQVDSQDVAERAGVSRSTVSLVLNNKKLDRISPATRQRVLEAARDLDYRRNAAAYSLVTGRTNRIGIVLNHPYSFRSGSLYHTYLLEGILKEAVEQNVNLLFHTSRYADTPALCNDILNGSADGLLVIGNYPDPALYRTLIASQFPVVYISHCPNDASAHSVDCENETGGYLAVSHLLALGHRHIAFLYDAEMNWQQERWVGVERAIAESISRNVSLEKVYCSDEAAALNYVRTASPRPTALICVGEGPAPFLVAELPEHGIRVPEDLAIINFNSTENCDRAAVPITSIWQPFQQIGATAVMHLADLIAGLDVAPGILRLPVRLDIRKSSGASRTDFA